MGYLMVFPDLIIPGSLSYLPDPWDSLGIPMGFPWESQILSLSSVASQRVIAVTAV